jgi:hypothetical protein
MIDDTEVDLEKRIGQFVKLRDLKAEIAQKHAEELKPINEALDQLKEVMKAGLDKLNIDSAKTSCGTASFTTKASASIADKDAFWAHVVTQGAWELLDYKANVTAVKDYIENNNGNQPPGVNYSSFRDINVRRPTGT